MQPPKHALVRVDLIPVAGDIIAELGDYLEVHNGVVIGVWDKNNGAQVNAIPPPAITHTVPSVTGVKKKSTKASKPEHRNHSHVTYDIVMEQAKALQGDPPPLLSDILNAVQTLFNDKSIPEHVIRARLEGLVSKGRLDMIKRTVRSSVGNDMTRNAYTVPT